MGSGSIYVKAKYDALKDATVLVKRARIQGIVIGAFVVTAAVAIIHFL